MTEKEGAMKNIFTAIVVFVFLTLVPVVVYAGMTDSSQHSATISGSASADSTFGLRFVSSLGSYS